MIKPDYLSPIISSIMNQPITAKRSIKKKKGAACRSRSSIVLNQSRPVVKSYVYRMFCSRILPMLDWDFSKDLCFNPKKIKKVQDRKRRKACYQSFALYKKSFKPVPNTKVTIFKDELPKILSKSAKSYGDHLTDAFAFFSARLKNANAFKKQWICTWDLGTGDESKSII